MIEAKTYDTRGPKIPQVLEGLAPKGLRFMRKDDGSLLLQMKIYGERHGEDLPFLWVDIPVVNEAEERISYFAIEPK